jgi:hydrogenase maturation protein HypF
MVATANEVRQRRAIRVRGVVQGVGFRPAMFRLADSLALAGFVRNDPEGVWLEIEGTPDSIARFLDQIHQAAPPASRIDRIETAIAAVRGDVAFQIAASERAASADAPAAGIPCDLAPCGECLTELADHDDRRFGYPFINCTACGPRFTIVRDVPYDRPKTTMATFRMCAACQREYDDPRDRRFHAEPNACPACGPQLSLVVGGAIVHTGAAALAAAAGALTIGSIVAIKGAGGYVLACDATNETAVDQLRVRKRRPHKPFAVMARTLDELARIAVLSESARAALASPARPIVLVPVRGDSPIARAVAPGLGDLGVYLPPTPLQHLLLTRGPSLQVMTSGNVSEEPIARTEAEARARLVGIADAFLCHDRDVHARTDDSVVRASARHAIPMRRARGHVPDAIALPVGGPPVLAVGGHQRNTVCLTRGGQAILSQHVGDLDHPDSFAFFREAIDHLRELVGAAPIAVAHDLHPDYRSTRWAMACGLPTIGVQHHHAHVAACLSEHGRGARGDRVIGVAFDGTGYGEDGTLWGGEIFDADLGTCRRLGRLRPIALAGGEAAIRAPWRLALAALLDAGEDPAAALHGISGNDLRRVTALLATDVPPRASGAGRWFDAVAALLGAAGDVSYDGQAAAQLEALAERGFANGCSSAAAPLAYAVADTVRGQPFELDLRPTISAIVDGRRRGVAPSTLALRFHATLAAMITAACRRARVAGTPPTVVLTGGCFQNRLLLERTVALLEADGFEVLVHRRVPCNDGGLALGQAAIASFRLTKPALEEPCV